jgi:hypothetical protein
VLSVVLACARPHLMRSCWCRVFSLSVVIGFPGAARRSGDNSVDWRKCRRRIMRHECPGLWLRLGFTGNSGLRCRPARCSDDSHGYAAARVPAWDSALDTADRVSGCSPRRAVGLPLWSSRSRPATASVSASPFMAAAPRSQPPHSGSGRTGPGEAVTRPAPRPLVVAAQPVRPGSARQRPADEASGG